MSWQDFEGVDDCLLHHTYRFPDGAICSCHPMKWFEPEPENFHTAVVDEDAPYERRTFLTAICFGHPEESGLFKNPEYLKKIAEYDFACAHFIGQAEEDGKWYCFLASSNPDEESEGDFELEL